MAKKTPTIQDKTFTLWDSENDRAIMQLDLTKLADWPYWINWLDLPTTKSFRYVGKDGTACTVVKETRLNFGKKDKPLLTFWYAHKRLGRLRRQYLGKSEDLTYQRLKQVAFELSQRELL